MPVVQTLTPDDYTLKGRLVVPRNGDHAGSPIPVPFGALPRRKTELELTLAGGNASRLTAGGSRLIPTYSGRIQRGGHTLQLRGVTRDVHRAEANQLITRCHYLNPPVRGFIVGCWFADPDSQAAARKRAEARPMRSDRWSPAWSAAPGGMVACAVIDRLMHGNPRGRREIAVAANMSHLLRDDWQSLNRRTVVESIGVAWVSRFAVDAPYRGLGIGEALATVALSVARDYIYPSASYVEVITTLPTIVAREMLAETRTDFIANAGYTRFAEARPSSQLLGADEDSGDKVRLESAKKLYYYAAT